MKNIKRLFEDGSSSGTLGMMMMLIIIPLLMLLIVYYRAVSSSVYTQTRTDLIVDGATLAGYKTIYVDKEEQKKVADELTKKNNQLNKSKGYELSITSENKGDKDEEFHVSSKLKATGTLNGAYSLNRRAASRLILEDIGWDIGDLNVDLSDIDLSNLRGRIKLIALTRYNGMPYHSGSLRMSDRYADCSSLVYRVCMEALGRNWKGTWAPTTSNFAAPGLWREIPLRQAKPWDIVHRYRGRSGHVEFLTEDGRTFGAHMPGVPSGYSGKFRPSDWDRAYRLIGL